MNLDCNFKPPKAKRSQHQRLMSAATSNKQQVDTRSMTLFTGFLRIVKAILSRFKQAHLVLPPAAENRGPRPIALIKKKRKNHENNYYCPP